MNDTTRFVTFPLGEERYALDSSQVKELVMPSQVYSFPHTMQSLEGVLVRRGAVIPVCDLRAPLAMVPERKPLRDCAMQLRGTRSTVAIPVSGDCELVQGERDEAPSNDPEAVTFVAGLLRTGGRTVPLLDLDQVVAHCIQPAIASAREAKR